MAISANVVPVVDRRNYRELPKGMSRWTCIDATLTGVGTSVVTFNILFNLAQDPNFQRYVSVSRIGLETATQPMVILGVEARLNVDMWEETPGANQPVAVFELVNTPDAASYAGVFNSPFYCGRTLKGTFGRIQIFCQEIASTTYTLTMAGFISEKPFLAPEIWRA